MCMQQLKMVTIKRKSTHVNVHSFYFISNIEMEKKEEIREWITRVMKIYIKRFIHSIAASSNFIENKKMIFSISQMGIVSPETIQLLIHQVHFKANINLLVRRPLSIKNLIGNTKNALLYTVIVNDCFSLLKKVDKWKMNVIINAFDLYSFTSIFKRYFLLLSCSLSHFLFIKIALSIWRCLVNSKSLTYSHRV